MASRIIAELVAHGVRKVCISPGSRSSPLAVAAAREPRLEKLVHFDERGMAFHAYGFAKASNTPVAIITTSGSAVGNIFPAIMEASHDHVPLIVLTADRPTELQETMANQTCDQVKIFGNYVRWSAEIPPEEISNEWLSSTIAYAISKSTLSPPGPVHLNCHFREPLSFASASQELPSIHYEVSEPMISTTSLKKWAEKLSSFKRGVIIAGHMPPSKKHNAVFALAEKLDWPIIPDLMSGLRSQGSHSTLIPYFIDLLKSATDLEPNCILHLGDRLISKPLQAYARAPTYIMVADHPNRCDPHLTVTDRIVMDPSVFCEQILPHINSQSSWLGHWKDLSHLIEGHIDDAIDPNSEPGLIRYLHHHIPSHYAAYFSNSMPIRDADRFFFPRLHHGPIFGQRGLSGIDGNIATAVGLAEGAGRPLVAVLGDLAALHDINSLAQLRKSKVPVILVIINNSGGGIFSFLPINKENDVFEEYIAGAHDLKFAKAAEMFQIPYASLTNFEDLHRALRTEKTTILEFPSSRIRNVTVHEAVDQKILEIIQHYGAALR